MCFFKLMFAWYNVFYPSIFIQLMSLYLKWVSFRNHMVGSWFFFFFFGFFFVLIYSTNLGILICVFRPFIFKVTIGILGLKYAILLCIFCLFLLSGSLVSVGYLNIFFMILSWFIRIIWIYHFVTFSHVGIGIGIDISYQKLLVSFYHFEV